MLTQIQQKILDGRLRVGDRLPSERELGEALGVSRNSVREALRVLESMGILSAQVGSGRDAGSTVAGRSTAALSNLLRLHMALSQFSLEDLVDVRIELERLAVVRAAAGADVGDLERLRALTRAMAEPGMDYERFHELDSEFHIALTRASDNALATDLMQALRDAVKGEMIAAFRRVRDWEVMVSTLTEEHLAILRAVEAGDGKEAAELVTQHIKGFYAAVGDAPE
ncbi:FadR/GntR family transcriptional regulator [Streptomyces xiaopingdaonensis]|uniref:FadR/GntR family transcriptional regulator n=1 Tax=Streptomyces xiaopingdaonensis TaxID=1565415 RepID=UPI000D0AA32D|nr:FCD domain-containing protein [Streptomyces xiaopingdaonensis]